MEIEEIKKHVEEKLEANKMFKLDYFKICNAATLKEINNFKFHFFKYHFFKKINRIN